jgi:hypothetical protein
MFRRLLPALFVLAALLADTGGSHGLAFVFLLLGIPAGFAFALDCYGEALESRSSRARPILAGASLLLLVLSAALHSPAVIGGVPKVGISALVLVLLLYMFVLIGALLPGGRIAPESA